MAAVPVKPNDSIPINVGWLYHLAPGGVSANWVEVIAVVNNKMVHVRGVDKTIADWVLPKWHFDDIVYDYKTPD